MRWFSLLVLLAAALLLTVGWADLPPTWAVHWGPHDVPNGWATKSVGGVFGPLLVGLAVWGLIEVTAVWMQAKGRRMQLAAAFVDIQVDFARAMGLAVVLLVAGLSLALPLLRPPKSVPIVAASVGLLASVILVAGIRAGIQAKALRAEGTPLPHGFDGILYRNADDPRLLVPKLMGVGWTLNFARPVAWFVLFALLFGPLVAMFGIFLLT